MKKILVFLSLICILSACGGFQQSDETMIEEYLSQAEDYVKQKKYDLAKLSFAEAIELSEKVYGSDSKEVADIYLELSVNNKNYVEALDNVASAEKIFQKNEDNDGLARTFHSYGSIYADFSEPELARKAYEDALRYCDMSANDQSELKFEIYLNLTGVETDFEELMYYFQRAEKLIENRNDAHLIRFYFGKGNTYYNYGIAEEAAACYEKAIEIWKEMEKDRDMNDIPLYIAYSYDCCGHCYIALEEYMKSIEYIDVSIEMFKNIEGVSIGDLATAYRHLSMAYMKLEVPDYEKALEYGLKSCQVYLDKEDELSIEELEYFKRLKDLFKGLYEETSYAKEQDFETWYKENINAK